MALLPQQFIDSVISIGLMGNNQRISWIATGFVFGYRDDGFAEHEYHLYIVTNKHVFNGHDTVYVRFNKKDNHDSKDYPLPLVEHGVKKYKEHPDPEVDVAVIQINPQTLVNDEVNIQFFQMDKHAFTVEQMKDKGVSEGDGIFAPGFPMGNIGHNEARKYVMVRSGCISRIQEMLDGYSKDFIVDALIFPGNSGGPVVLRPEIAAINGTVPITETRLIGVIKQNISYLDVAVSRQTGRDRIVFEDNTGLTLVESVDRIIETIKQ